MMTLNKKLGVLLFITLFCLTSNAQQRRQRSGTGNQQKSQSQQMPAFNPAMLSGIVMYKTKTVQKKLKLKENTNKEAVKKHIDIYNSEMVTLKEKNKELFDQITLAMDAKRNEARATRNFEIIKDAQLKIRGLLDPVRKEVQTSEMKLNSALKSELDENSFNSWLKYQKSYKMSLRPQRGSNNGTRGSSSRGQQRRN